MMKKTIIFVLFFVVGMMSGCASTGSSRDAVDPTNLQDLESLSFQGAQGSSESTIGKIRREALQDTAMSLGAQAGLVYRARQLDDMLYANNEKLSRVFNFTGLLSEDNVLPPVLLESEQSLKIDSPDLVRLSDHTYKILAPGRFVTAAPTWRDYLWMDFSDPTIPDRTLLPKNKKERELWIEYVNKGWEQGIAQANSIYKNNLATLKRDFNGMLLYRKLLAAHVIKGPFVATSNRGITSNAEHTEVLVNDQTRRITHHATLMPSQNWRPILVQP